MIRVFMIGMSQNKGGVEAYISNLCGELDAGKFEVVYQRPEMTIDGKTWFCPSNRHNYIKYYRFWKQFYRENRFDVLYFNTCDVVSIDQLRFAKAADVPVRIIHSHSTGTQMYINKRQSLFHRLSERNSRKTLDQYATHLFACSDEAGRWMFDGRPFTVIKNGIRLDEYRYCETKRNKIRKEFGYGEDIKIIGIIGRVSPQKNPLYAVEILKQFLPLHRDYRAVFVGDGELRSETEQAVKAAALDDRIYFTGAVDNVSEWLAAVDCLLMPSLFEGLPFILVEAQAAGLPCVVSSAVTRDANITGLIDYVDLETSLDDWERRIIRACGKQRKNTKQQMEEAGFSIQSTAALVSNIIEVADTAQFDQER